MLEVWIYFAESKCKALAVQDLNRHGKKINYIKIRKEIPKKLGFRLHYFCIYYKLFLR